MTSPAKHNATAAAVAAAVVALDPATLLFVGSVPANGRISLNQAADILDASRLRVFALMGSGELASENADGVRTLQICDVIALRDRLRTPKH